MAPNIGPTTLVAVFVLPELDSAFTDREILLADRRDGKPLSAEVGPLRIVMPGENARLAGVRQVSALRIQRAPAAGTAVQAPGGQG